MNRNCFFALVGAIALMLAYSLTTTGLSFFIAPITNELGYERGAFSLHYTIMTLVGAVTALFVSRIIRVEGLQRFLLIGCLLSTGALVAFSFCSSLLSFYLVAAVMGLLSTACTNMAAVILVNLCFPNNNGFYMGIVMAGTGLGGGILSILLPPFLASFGWRGGYLLLAGIWAGLTLLAFVMAGVGLSNAHAPDEDESQNHSQPAEGATFSQCVRSPSLYCFVMAVGILIMGSTIFQHLPAYFEEMGATPIVSGMIVSVFNFSYMTFKVVEGLLLDKVNPLQLLLIVSAAYAMGFWILLGSGLASHVAGVILLSTGIALVAVMPPVLTAKLYGNLAFPSIWGIVALAHNLGKAIGSPAWGAVYDAFGTYRPGIAFFPVCIGLCVILLILTFYFAGKAPWKKDTRR